MSRRRDHHTDHFSDQPADRHHDDQHDTPYDAELVERGDLTREFWGTSREWLPRDATESAPRTQRFDDTTGAVRAIRDGLNAFRPRRVELRDPSGQVRRTRLHGGSRAGDGPQRPEATIGELADRSLDDSFRNDPFLDDPFLDDQFRNDSHVSGPAADVSGGDPHDVGAAAFDDAAFVDIRSTAETSVAAIRRHVGHGGHTDVALTSEEEPLADRIGLGAVDPLLVRLGVMIVVGALLVPVALALRPSGADADSVRIESPEVVDGASGAAPLDGARDAVTMSADAATAAPSAAPDQAVVVDEQAAATPTASASNASADDLSPESVPAPSGDVASQDEPSVQSADLNEPETESRNATANPVVEAATVDEEANRVVPDCPQTYEAVAGDSWYGIAAAAGVSADSVLAENRATVNTVIFPGDEICLPGDATIPDRSAPPSTDPTDDPPSTTAPTTTAAPTTTVAPTTPPTSMTTAEIKQLVRDTFPEDPETALRIVARESNFDPMADNNFCCYGLFQIYFEVHKRWLDDFGVDTASDLFDPVKNVRAARHLYERAGGWSPWGF